MSVCFAKLKNSLATMVKEASSICLAYVYFSHTPCVLSGSICIFSCPIMITFPHYPLLYKNICASICVLIAYKRADLKSNVKILKCFFSLKFVYLAIEPHIMEQEYFSGLFLFRIHVLL